jgi:hypothetical protein
VVAASSACNTGATGDALHAKPGVFIDDNGQKICESRKQEEIWKPGIQESSFPLFPALSAGAIVSGGKAAAVS